MSNKAIQSGHEGSLQDEEPAFQPARMYFSPAAITDATALAELGIEAQDNAPEPPSFFRRFGLFIGLVVIPSVIALIYFGLIAAGLYISETKFIVRTSSSGSEISLSSLLQSPGMSRAVDETYAVSTYMSSRDMVAKLEKERRLRDILSRPEADFVYKFPNIYSKDNSEALYEAFQRFIDIDVDVSTGITTLKTKAFRAEDALALSRDLLEFADEFINRLNNRAHTDSIQFAELLVRETTKRLSDIETRLTDYRNKEMVLNPEKESVASLEMLTKLSTLIAKEEATLAQQVAQTPDSPVLASQREKIKSLRNEFEKQRRSIAGGENSIASKLEGFERLALERELAAKGLAQAVIELEKSRQFAQTQRIYLQTIVAPNMADQAARPLRLLSVIVVMMVCSMLFWIVKSLRDIILEHQA
ncbi:MAG: capsule biosynthesis protein [Proteobacteria bacterium]|nr:capsule biosynthesis protein [Pseudomonadota bacterium]